MIRHDITEADLRQAIQAHDSKWLGKATKRAKKIAAAKAFTEKSSIWSDVKDVYRRLQNHKCAFCERQLASSRYGAIEHDVEHFRPKSSVANWSHPNVPDTWHQPGRAGGYYWLAYELLNYATSCKVCNSPLKGNRFPVSSHATPGAPTDSPAALNASEQPMLIYPIGPIDTDPDTLLRFDGLLVLPKDPDTATHAHRRAAVTVAFFELNSREELWQGRATVIKLVFEALKKRFHPRDPQEAVDGAADLRTYTSASYPHAACARSFERVFHADPVRAFRIYQAARQIDADLANGVAISAAGLAV